MRKCEIMYYDMVTRKWEQSEGWFHTWGLEEAENFAISVAIVEIRGGRVVTCTPENITFKE